MLYLLRDHGRRGVAGSRPRDPRCGASRWPAYDFFFVPPHHDFTVADSRYLLTFVMMFGVGIVISTLTIRLRRQRQEASAREERTAALYALSRDLGAAVDTAQIVAAGERHIRARWARRRRRCPPSSSGSSTPPRGR
jgi:K+-sensing histidine kinase KdpD